MGHGKLKKFAENETFRCLLQPSAEEVLVRGGASVPVSGSHPALVLRPHPIRGNWNRQMFAAEQPIVSVVHVLVQEMFHAIMVYLLDTQQETSKEEKGLNQQMAKLHL